MTSPRQFADGLNALHKMGRAKGAAPFCNRSLAVYKPGVPMADIRCIYAYTGRIPNTGSRRCMLCGNVHPDDEVR
jgi:hypothetical protein